MGEWTREMRVPTGTHPTVKLYDDLYEAAADARQFLVVGDQPYRKTTAVLNLLDVLDELDEVFGKSSDRGRR